MYKILICVHCVVVIGYVAKIYHDKKKKEKLFIITTFRICSTAILSVTLIGGTVAHGFTQIPQKHGGAGYITVQAITTKRAL